MSRDPWDALSASERLESMGVPTDALGEFIERHMNEAPAAREFASAVLGSLSRNPSAAAQAQALAAEDEKAAAAFALGFHASEQASEARRNTIRGAGDGLNGTGKTTYLPIGGPESSRYGFNRGQGVGPKEFHGNEPQTYAGQHAGDDMRQQLGVAYERWQRTGNKMAAEAYGKLRLHGIITDEFLNQ